MSDAPAQICALIPVKAFSQAKQRLSPFLTSDQRASLARVMLEDVLAAVMRVGLCRVAVVTADEEAAQLAASFGATIVREAAGHGIDAAIETALRDDAIRKMRGIAVIPSDIPEATTAIFAAALAGFATARGAVIVASRDGGTNLLACAPADAIAPAFGPGSFARHLAAARQAGLPVHSPDIAALGRDIDTPDDLRGFMARATTTRTHKYLLAVMHGLDPRIHHHDKAF